MMINALVRGIRENIFAILFFSLLVIIGLFIYKDYGVPWDEPTQRNIGYANVNYLVHQDASLLEMKDRFYGPTYEIFLIGVEKLIQPAAIRDVYFLRHLLIFLTFFAGAACFYFLCANIYWQRSTALLASIALVLSPRIFDNAFYNSKDIPLLVFFIICFLLLFQYLDTKKTCSKRTCSKRTCSKRTWLLVLIAFFSAITTTIRIAGIIVPFLTAVAIIGNRTWGARANQKREVFTGIRTAGWFLGLFALFTLLFWPILWSNPIANFAQAVQGMSHFQWVYTVLFMGTRYEGSQIPAIYPVVWILITTPIFYTILFFSGVICAAAEIRNGKAGFFEGERMKLIFSAAWFFVPLLLVMILRSTLYDSWRHLFFIYPAFLLLAFWGLERAIFYLRSRFGRVRWLLIAIYAVLMLTFFATARFMIQAHPYEQLYFNVFAGSRLSDIQDRYDMDYWGLAYRSGLEYISQNDRSQSIQYVAETMPGTYTFILPEKDQERLIPTGDEGEAKYLLTNYRFSKTYPAYHEVYSVEVEGAKILSVFELR